MKKYLVIGNPIGHSLSPKLHNHWIKKNNIDAVYDKKQLNENDIEGTIFKVRNGEIDGINVTVPFKKSVIPYLDQLTPLANEAQSVNTIFKRDNKVAVTENGVVIAHQEDEIRKEKLIYLDLKEYLESIMIDSNNKKTKYIESYKSNCSDTKVNFEIKFNINSNCY